MTRPVFIEVLDQWNPNYENMNVSVARGKAGSRYSNDRNGEPMPPEDCVVLEAADRYRNPHVWLTAKQARKVGKALLAYADDIERKRTVK